MAIGLFSYTKHRSLVLFRAGLQTFVKVYIGLFGTVSWFTLIKFLLAATLCDIKFVEVLRWGRGELPAVGYFIFEAQNSS